MGTRIERTLDALHNSGWAIHASDQKLHWWIDGVFELHSIWNPAGAKIYLTLDVDPDTTSNRRKGERIVSISSSKTIPESRLSIEQVTFYLSAFDDKGITQLVKSSNDFRNEIKKAGFGDC